MVDKITLALNNNILNSRYVKSQGELKKVSRYRVLL